MAKYAALSDRELAERTRRVAAAERVCSALLVAHLAEMERRGLHVELGFPSLFAYCVQELGFSEAAAYKRIQAARLACRLPIVLKHLAEGRLHMAALVILAPHLTEENHARLLAQALGKRKRELEMLAASLATTSAEGGRPRVPPSAFEPLGEGFTRVSFTADEPLLEMLDRVRGLLRHKHPSGGLLDVFTETSRFFLSRKDPERRSASGRGVDRRAGEDGASRKRRIPQRVKDAVWARDGGQCSFIAPQGRRCAERGGLEYDHVIPWALGGASDKVENVRLLCRAHNQWAAKKIFGERFGVRRSPDCPRGQ